MRGEVRAQAGERRELLITVGTGQQVLGVLSLLELQLVVVEVFPERGLFVEALRTLRAGEGLGVTGHVLLELVFLMEALLTALAEETLQFVQLSAAETLLLATLLRVCGCLSLHLQFLRLHLLNDFQFHRLQPAHQRK